MKNQFNEVKELQEQGYSLRAIGDDLGISKSQVQRILKKGQLSQNESDTFLDMSQSVPKSSQYDDDTDRDIENEVFEKKKHKKNSVREIKKREYLLKSDLNIILQELIDQDNFTLDELNECIESLREGKKFADMLYTERLDFDDNAVDNAAFFLNDLVRFLKQPQSKMKSLRPKELLKDRSFKFVESVRPVEYDEQDDEEDYEDEYIDVVAVKLFSSVYDTMKDRIEEFLEAKLLNDITI
jgi:transcriptional regulator with XRE-family HTH domain